MDIEENNAIANIRKFGNEELLWKFINSYTGYEYIDGSNLDKLAAHILFTALSVSMKSSFFKGMDKLVSEVHGQRCYDLIDEWMHSESDGELYDIARDIEEKFSLAARFDEMEIADLLDSECFPCINESILRHFMTEIAESIIKIEDIVVAVEKRRTLKWYKRVRYYFDGLLQVAQMQQFYQQHAQGFHIAEYKEFWTEYCNDYCKMDRYYRLFHTAFAKSLKESSTTLEDLYKGVAGYVEKLYKNWYLQELGAQWNILIGDELFNDVKLQGIPHQTGFYRNYVRPLSNSGRTYVIISDALRYEVAVDITEQLLQETKGNAKLSSMQSIFPSTTKFGMAALLPHDALQLTDDGNVLCDGMSTDGTENRSKILNAVHKGNVAVAYKALLSMTKAEHDELIGNAEIIYIYHNTIDAVGDKNATEDRVFEACEDAVNEIKNLVRRITNTFKGTNILITADHGFLYSYKPLEEIDKVEKSLISGEIVELDRRYVLVGGDCTADHMQRIPMKHVNSTLTGFTPLQNIRIKKVGGGMNYVHGGISLQECVVPVIEFKNIKSNSKKFVDVKNVELQLLSQSRKISNGIFALDFYQKEAVSGKLMSAEYEIYMSDASGKIVSDCQKIIADKTSTNGADRVFRTRFTLKSMEFKKTESYYLNIVEKKTATIIDHIRVQLEVDFIANKEDGRRYYIQSAFAIPTEDKRNQETKSLRKIPDSFKKIVIVRDNIIPWRDDNGILYLGIEQFLLEPNAIDL